MEIYKEKMNLIITPHIGRTTIESINNTEVFISNYCIKKLSKIINEKKNFYYF